MERMAFELNPHGSKTDDGDGVRILEIRSARHQFVVGFADKIQFSVGQGQFSQESDRSKVASLMLRMVENKLLCNLQDGKVHEYRMTLCLQKHYFKGFDIEPISNILGFTESAHPNKALARFMHETGFADMLLPDDAGWSPACYAAVDGDAAVLTSLLEHKADPNERILNSSDTLCQFPPGTPLLTMTAFLSNAEAMTVLINARADPNGQDGYRSEPLHWAAAADNVGGIRQLLAAGAKADQANMLGASPFDMAAQFGCAGATQELVAFVSQQEVGAGLHWAARHDHADADTVWALIEAGADVDQQLSMPLFSPLGLMFSYFAVKHRWHHSILSNYAYHHEGATPLMCSILNCNFQVAAALVVGGAKLDLKNARGKTALELAELMSVPDYLAKALQAHGSEYESLCRRTRSEASIAMSATKTNQSLDTFSI